MTNMKTAKPWNYMLKQPFFIVSTAVYQDIMYQALAVLFEIDRSVKV